MSRPEVPDADKVIETWEITCPGTVWVYVFDRRQDRYSKARVSGTSGTRRLHISRDDRKFNQEQVSYEHRDLDPFTNGMLRLIDSSADADLDTRNHLSTEQLEAMLEVKDEAAFKTTVDDINSELILRRLLDVTERLGTIWQLEIVREVVHGRYALGGTQKTVRELLSAGEKLGVPAL